MKRILSQLIIVLGTTLSLMLLVGCATSTGGAPNVSYKDPTTVETLTADFGSSDLQQIAEAMVNSMLTFPPIVQVTAERRPVIFVETIKNKTREHIDTEAITDTISTRLIQSGKFRFVDRTKVDAILKELQYQASGIVDESTRAQFGRQIGAEYMLYGNFSSIEKTAGRVKDVYYKFTLKLMNVETGIIEWQDEKEIRKVATRRLIGP
ncbi:MAG: penicillin-binding protein activator LpoB [Candidatus Hydrogenedentes bacterium]|nr:penicillin-binding protein activator LpoB [Candidatus Hydrogenedentota bacterium]